LKYARLTPDQLHALHAEFSRFLAAQSIDKAEWDDIKASRPHVAEQEIDVFSDLIWEGILARARYLEHFAPRHIFLFECGDAEIRSIVIKSSSPEIDLMASEGLSWLDANIFSDSVEIKTGRKAFTNRNEDIFGLIQQGAVPADGAFYRRLSEALGS
jgi:hypothetical protein